MIRNGLEVLASLKICFLMPGEGCTPTTQHTPYAHRPRRYPARTFIPSCLMLTNASPSTRLQLVIRAVLGEIELEPSLQNGVRACFIVPLDAGYSCVPAPAPGTVDLASPPSRLHDGGPVVLNTHYYPNTGSACNAVSPRRSRAATFHQPGG